MKIKIFFIVVLSLIPLSSVAGDPIRGSFSDAKPFLDSITSADSISIYEGLPSQGLDRSLMDRERARSDIFWIAKFPFYAPALNPEDQQSLKSILSAASTLELIVFEKLCGAFHPDYCVTWDSEQRIFNALICFGCEEIIFESEGKTFRYYLDKNAYNELKKVLSVYVVKRPKK